VGNGAALNLPPGPALVPQGHKGVLNQENGMGANEENIWLLKVNPKLLEFLDRLLRLLEQPPMSTQEEEKGRGGSSLPEGLLRVPEAAKRLRISGHTLRGWISQRRIRFVKIGRRVLINHADLDNLIQSNTAEPWKPRRKV